MTANNKSIAKAVAVATQEINHLPPVANLTSPRAAELYSAILSSVSSSTRTLTSIRILAGELAEAIAERELASDLVQTHGLVQTDPRSGLQKPNPAVQIRHQASMRAQALMLRLRLLPQSETRVLQSQAAYEQSVGMPGFTTIDPSDRCPDTVDWVTQSEELAFAEIRGAM